MKFLYCKKCGDVVGLRHNGPRHCACGSSSGRYVDKKLEHGVYKGEHAVPFGFSNGQFAKAIMNQPESNVEGGKRFEAFVVPKITPTFYREGDGAYDMDGCTVPQGAKKFEVKDEDWELHALHAHASNNNARS